MAVARYALFSRPLVGNTPGVGAQGDVIGDGSDRPDEGDAGLSPRQIATMTFSQRGAGVDRVEVTDFLAHVARQTDVLQHRLAVAQEQIVRLSADAAASRVENRGAAEVACCG